MGAGITVAVIDNGLHEAHPDLTDNVDTARGHDYSEGGHGLLNPLDSHGTSVAGVIAARDNTLGGRGVAPAQRSTGTTCCGPTSTRTRSTR